MKLSTLSTQLVSWLISHSKDRISWQTAVVEDDSDSLPVHNSQSGIKLELGQEIQMLAADSEQSSEWEIGMVYFLRVQAPKAQGTFLCGQSF